jgi:hypothetical protein
MLAGSVNWNVTSSKLKPEPSELLWEPHVLSFFKDIPIRDVAVGTCGSTITFVTQSGHVFAMGKPHPWSIYYPSTTHLTVLCPQDATTKDS